MQATTVRVNPEVKKEFDRLQGLVQAETGERPSHSDLLAELLRFVRRHEMQFFAERAEPEWKPPGPEGLRFLLRDVRDWGIETDASKIDEVLYGGRE